MSLHHEPTTFEKIIRLTVIAGLSTAALTGCAVETVGPEPNSTEKVKTLQEYVDQFTEYKNPAELTLPAGANAEQFGQWVIGLEQKWQFASCDQAGDMINASTLLDMSDTELYKDVAESDGATLTVAYFGKNGAPQGSAEKWHDNLISTNEKVLQSCALGNKEKVPTEDFVSATQEGSTYTVNSIINPNGADINGGPFTATYETAVEDGNIVVVGLSK